MIPANNSIAPGTVVTLQVISQCQKYLSIHTYFATYHFWYSNSILSYLKKIHSDITWSSLCSDAFPYYIAPGVSSIANCRTCGFKFTKDELRIRTTLLRKMQSSIRPCQINFCLSCVKKRLITKKIETYYKDWVLFCVQILINIFQANCSLYWTCKSATINIIPDTWYWRC